MSRVRGPIGRSKPADLRHQDCAVAETSAGNGHGSGSAPDQPSGGYLVSDDGAADRRPTRRAASRPAGRPAGVDGAEGGVPADVSATAQS